MIKEYSQGACNAQPQPSRALDAPTRTEFAISVFPLFLPAGSGYHPFPSLLSVAYSTRQLPSASLPCPFRKDLAVSLFA